MDEIKHAAGIILNGGIVAFPTETVYGLGANALDAKAVRKVFALKGRPADNPVIVHVSGRPMLESIVKLIPDSAEKLMKAFWPGPLTLIFEKADRIPNATTSHLPTVAVRSPSNLIAKQLIETAGVPIAAPSANKAGKPSSTKAQHVRDDFDEGGIDKIIDGGPCEIGVESTVVDCTCDPPLLLRPGTITLEQLKSIIPSINFVEFAKGAPRSPGMKYRHYAPITPLRIAEDLASAIKDERNKGLKVGVIKMIEQPLGGHVEIYVGSSETEYAHNLFDAMRVLDKEHLGIIIAQQTGESGQGLAIMNRLRKASLKE